jgi:hypothetical protein
MSLNRRPRMCQIRTRQNRCFLILTYISDTSSWGRLDGPKASAKPSYSDKSTPSPYPIESVC